MENNANAKGVNMMRKRQIQDLMTQDEIIEMAQECKLIGMRPFIDGIYTEALIEFAKLVAAKEREKWSEVEAYLIAASEGSMSRNNSEALAGELLIAIRARGQA
jgi:hypothetical protein